MRSEHWSNAEFAKIHNDRNNLFTGADLSWIEARKFNELAIGALEAQAHSDSGAAGLASLIKTKIATLRPRITSTAGLVKASQTNDTINCGQMQVRFDATSGAQCCSSAVVHVIR
eukprot:SAG31_NODE_208_length_20313_cov_6.143119_7_plen_115_part_00